MMPSLTALLKAKAILDAAAVPKNDRVVWVTKAGFLQAGGTLEEWEKLDKEPCDPGPSLIELYEAEAKKDQPL